MRKKDDGPNFAIYINTSRAWPCGMQLDLAEVE